MPSHISTFEHSEKNRFNGFSPFLCGIFFSFFVFIENQSTNEAGIFDQYIFRYSVHWCTNHRVITGALGVLVCFGVLNVNICKRICHCS